MKEEKGKRIRPVQIMWVRVYSCGDEVAVYTAQPIPKQCPRCHCGVIARVIKTTEYR